MFETIYFLFVVIVSILVNVKCMNKERRKERKKENVGRTKEFYEISIFYSNDVGKGMKARKGRKL